MGQVALVGSVILAAAVSQAPADRAGDFTKLTVEELKAGIGKQHPAAYYVLAKKLFQGGAQDEAVFHKVLAWDEKTDNGFTSKTKHTAAWNSIRDGLRKMRAYVVQNGEAIRADRTKNGLPNRRRQGARVIA